MDSNVFHTFNVLINLFKGINGLNKQLILNYKFQSLILRISS